MTISSFPTVGIITSADLSTNADVFPTASVLPGQDFIVEKAPEFSTAVQRSSTGREVRVARWSSPRWNFKLQWNVLRDGNRVLNGVAMTELSKLLGAFCARLGRFGFFFFLDPDDNTVTNQTVGFGTGDTFSYQLLRTVGSGVYAYPAPVYALWKVPVVKVNSDVAVYGFDYHINTGGVLTFVAAPPTGSVISWSGQFLHVCAFDTDKLSVAQISRGFWEQKGLPFYSIKP